jgi:histidine triad (HIT) family protein
MATIFTKIINREIPAEIVFENNNIIVIKDINPEAKTHLLLIPKKEIPTINDLQESDNELFLELFYTAKQIAIELGIEQGYKLHFNVGSKEQDVMHIHLHLLSNI